MTLTPAQETRKKQLQEEIAKLQAELEGLGARRVEPTRTRLKTALANKEARLASYGEATEVEVNETGTG